MIFKRRQRRYFQVTDNTLNVMGYVTSVNNTFKFYPANNTQFNLSDLGEIYDFIETENYKAKGEENGNR